MSESFHNALVESDAESKSIDATRDWFGFGDDDENEDESSSDTDGNGKVTKFKIPKYLFDDPKIYEIRKLEKVKNTALQFQDLMLKRRHKKILMR